MTSTDHTARRPLGSRRGAFGVAAAAVLSAAMSCIVSVPAASASGVPVGQPLVVLLRAHIARSGPSVKAHATMTVAATRPLTGVRTVLPVLGRVTHRDGRTWLDVRLAGRPNGSNGWIRIAGTRPSWTAWRLSVDLDARLVTVYYRGRVVHRFPAVVGKPSTPTPQGSFFIEEGLSLSAWAAGAPFALATSARSDVLAEFDGGPGQIALHGMGNLPGALGTASSHGCIRLDAPDITWLAAHIGAGTPLRIVR
jgi:lipoprotein-anchoring transpeptidase ErfK/SrfK